MPITEDDLRELLTERSKGLDGPPDRLALVHRRIDRRRRRVQATAVAAVAVVAGALGAGLGLTGAAHHSPPSAAHQPSPAPSLPAYADGGRLLAGATLRSPGQGSVSFRFTPTSWGLEAQISSPTGWPRSSVAVVTVNGHLLTEGSEGGTTRVGQGKAFWSTYGVRLGRASTVTVYLASRLSRHDVPPPPQPARDRPAGVASVGVYQRVPYARYPLPSPPPTLLPLPAVKAGPMTRSLAARDVGTDGRWTIPVEVGTGIEITVSTVAPGRIRVLIDGHLVDTEESWDYARDGGGVGIADAYGGGLSGKGPHRSTVQVTVIADHFPVAGWQVVATGKD
ncbi:MAG: hypothetical protein ACJ74O_18890 [Frankiaceae bacterium]